MIKYIFSSAWLSILTGSIFLSAYGLCFTIKVQTDVNDFPFTILFLGLLFLIVGFILLIVSFVFILKKGKTKKDN